MLQNVFSSRQKMYKIVGPLLIDPDASLRHFPWRNIGGPSSKVHL